MFGYFNAVQNGYVILFNNLNHSFPGITVISGNVTAFKIKNEVKKWSGSQRNIGITEETQITSSEENG